MKGTSWRPVRPGGQTEAAVRENCDPRRPMDEPAEQKGWLEPSKDRPARPPAWDNSAKMSRTAYRRRSLAELPPRLTTR